MFMDMGYLELSNCIPLVAEMEFYLLEELDYDAIVFHPYPLLQRLCEACSAALFYESVERESGEDKHGLSSTSLNESSKTSDTTTYSRQLYQMTWLVTNDIYRTTLPLLYPPYVTAIASLYLSAVLLPTASAKIESAVLHGSSIDEPPAIVKFLGGLNVSNVVIADAVQAMLSYYHEWHDLQSSNNDEGPSLMKNPASIFAHALGL
ncbi:RNA polymerase II holoenzyme cyclin-like subunit [Malassezia psittaci]|uniref:RNA polymerase II holoenzyme cyclin-like subunit n=1 Tax=Malassezia psittaci TaxID=1821823 RepID=A0AAF0JEQ4_9BASI|nr:RNA polymerase II holoenzyme cyclin-like subunit [Malassezia psittaci]